jgi:Fe-S oxidoreductase
MFLNDKPELKEQLYRCSKCGYCRDTISDELDFYHVCPVYDVLRMEHFCGRGRATIALGLREEVIQFSEPLANLVYTDLGCGACREICPENIDIPAITRALRKEIVDRGLESPKLKQIFLALKDKHNIFGEEKPRSNWAYDLDLPNNGKTLYFAGCSASYTYPETARAIINILSEAGLKVAYLGEDEWCCGAPALWSGYMEFFENITRFNLSAIKASKAKTVIFGCAVCYNTFKTHYQSIIGKLPFKTLHISEVIYDLMVKGRIHLQSVRKKFTYHDPCHLGRDEKVYEPPREIIKKIPNSEFYEMPRNRRSAFCCGEGVIVSTLFPNLTRKISANRISEAKEIGANAIVTCCPGCVTTLSKAAAWLKSKEKVEIGVYDLPIVVAEAMRLKL